MRPDLQAARDVCVSVSVFMYVCFLVTEREERGGENTQEIRDLLITLCSVSSPLPPSIFLGSSILCQFIYRGLWKAMFFGSAVCYRLLVTRLLLKHHSRGLLSAPASASVYGKNMKAISSCIKRSHFSFNLSKCSMMSRTAALWTTVNVNAAPLWHRMHPALAVMATKKQQIVDMLTVAMLMLVQFDNHYEYKSIWARGGGWGRQGCGGRYWLRFGS